MFMSTQLTYSEIWRIYGKSASVFFKTINNNYKNLAKQSVEYGTYKSANTKTFPPHLFKKSLKTYTIYNFNDRYTNKIERQIANFKKNILRIEIIIAFDNKQKLISSNKKLSSMLRKCVPDVLLGDSLDRMDRIFKLNINKQLKIITNKFNLHYDRFHNGINK